MTRRSSFTASNVAVAPDVTRSCKSVSCASQNALALARIRDSALGSDPIACSVCAISTTLQYSTATTPAWPSSTRHSCSRSPLTVARAVAVRSSSISPRRLEIPTRESRQRAAQSVVLPPALADVRHEPSGSCGGGCGGKTHSPPNSAAGALVASGTGPSGGVEAPAGLLAQSGCCGGALGGGRGTLRASELSDGRCGGGSISGSVCCSAPALPEHAHVPSFCSRRGRPLGRWYTGKRRCHPVVASKMLVCVSRQRTFSMLRALIGIGGVSCIGCGIGFSKGIGFGLGCGIDGGIGGG
mmetsp:Transcript_42979/g.100718  ORF Transcript_42979/g.100718 Transcript_42979/m.100718 type:complete len:298 (+) Transcript_42979:277-1170(+)